MFWDKVKNPAVPESRSPKIKEPLRLLVAVLDCLHPVATAFVGH